jgi:hypothetical protein
VIYENPVAAAQMSNNPPTMSWTAGAIANTRVRITTDGTPARLAALRHEVRR